MKSLRVIFILLLALAPAAMTEALQRRVAPVHEGSLRTSKIVGVVLDKTEARIAGATIKIESAGFSRTVESDEGGFEVGVPAGVYRLTVEREGFKRVVLSPFRVRAGAHKSVSIHMEVKEPPTLLRVE